MKINGRRRDGLKLERLEARTVFAAVAGSVWVDLNGDSQIDAGDEPVPSALVWVDTNRNRAIDAGEPQTRSAADGSYAFSGLPAGDYEIRMQPTPGLFQTSPSQYFAFYRNDLNFTGLAAIDMDTGSVTQLTPAVGATRGGLIKTVEGEFYASDISDDGIYRVDPVTGVQTFVGDTGKKIVAGLAYDPVMDKIYTLARDTDTDSPPLLLYEVDRQTGALTRIGAGEGVDGIRSTSGMTFDLVNRQVVLFDNNLDEVIAYDLNGNGRKLSTFASGVGFYNLAFDGHRFLTFDSDNQFTTAYELDIDNATLSPIRSIDEPLWVGAADMLASNEPYRVHLESDDDFEPASLDFLTNRMNITQGTLEIDDTNLHLSSTDKGLELDAPLSDDALPLRFCVGALASNLVVDQSLTSSKAIELQTSPLGDRLSINVPPLVTIEMGAGRDTLVPTGPMELNLPELTSNLTGVDVIDLSDSDAVTLVSDAASIRTITDAKKLSVVASSEDDLGLSTQPWTAMAPVAAGERRLHELSLADVILELDDGLGWRNPLDAMDVNYDGSVSPLDALLIINLLNQTGSRSLNATDSSLAQAEYVDSSGDNFVSPIDALLVINEINSRS